MKTLNLSTILVILALGLECQALKCHQCSSILDQECADPMWNEPAAEGQPRLIKTEKFLKDCPKNGHNYTICRKIDQNIRGDRQVIRSCGYIEHKNECYNTVLEEYSTLVCQCKIDGCNSAPTVTISVGLMVLLTSMLAYWA